MKTEVRIRSSYLNTQSITIINEPNLRTERSESLPSTLKFPKIGQEREC